MWFWPKERILDGAKVKAEEEKKTMKATGNIVVGA